MIPTDAPALDVPLLEVIGLMLPVPTGPRTGWFLLATFVIAAVLVAWAAHRLVEAPAEAWLRAHPGFRWVTVVPPDQPDVAIILSNYVEGSDADRSAETPRLTRN